MADDREELYRQIGDLQQTIRRLEEAARVQVSGGTIQGPVVGHVDELVVNYFGASPPPDGGELLRSYLDAVIAEHGALRLQRLTGRVQTGQERESAPTLRLADVYTSLTTDGPPVVVESGQKTAAELRELVKTLGELGPEVAPPEDVRRLRVLATGAHGGAWVEGERSLEGGDETRSLGYRLARPELAVEAVCARSRLVLLGEPGAGKSTLLRYLTLLLAMKHKGEKAAIAGWPEADRSVPVFCPLGKVASLLDGCGGDATKALRQALAEALDGGHELRRGLRDHLMPAMRRGAVLLLFDGLDEVPASADDTGTSPRERISAALRGLARELPANARIVVTSRVLAYETPAERREGTATPADVPSWQLPAEERWEVRRIQPLAFGQVRSFARSWYGAVAAAKTAPLSAAEAGVRAEALIDEIEASPGVLPLVRSPLLLTMLAVLHLNRNVLPEDRATLYEECVKLLLERWETVRTPEATRPGLLERLGRPPDLTIEAVRGVLQELAFDAHRAPPLQDGRGALATDLFRGRLLKLLERARVAESGQKVETVLGFIREDAGLLAAPSDDLLAFPHLTFEEYLAACHLASLAGAPGDDGMLEVAYRLWHGEDAARWREVLLLLVGRLRQTGAVERDAVPWLERLMQERLGREPKATAARLRDAALAAMSWTEIGGRSAFVGTRLDPEEKLEGPLRRTIRTLLETPDESVSLHQRIAAGRVLGELGDDRFPVSVEEWRRELGRRNRTFGAPDGYWCWVPGGEYRVGGWEKGQSEARLRLDGFWIARFPLTVAQYRPFVEEGYGEGAERWWTPRGLAWKEESRREQPRSWDDPPYTVANQPVIGVTWYEAMAFAAWFDERLATAAERVRLPTEAEWEMAAAFDGGGGRREYPWGSDAPDASPAVYDATGDERPAPAGCCPAGAAASGALDMAGNVWEWTASRYDAYPGGSGTPVEDLGEAEWQGPIIRGGSWMEDERYLCCGARVGLPSVFRHQVIGFRLVVVPRLANSS